MIDWFASKAGMLVFLAAVLGSLLLFADMQAGIHEQGRLRLEAQAAANFFDLVCEGCTVYMNFTRARSLDVSEHSLALDGLGRNFTSRAEPCILDVRELRFYREEGVVHAEEA